MEGGRGVREEFSNYEKWIKPENSYDVKNGTINTTDPDDSNKELDNPDDQLDDFHGDGYVYQFKPKDSNESFYYKCYPEKEDNPLLSENKYPNRKYYKPGKYIGYGSIESKFDDKNGEYSAKINIKMPAYPEKVDVIPISENDSNQYAIVKILQKGSDVSRFFEKDNEYAKAFKTKNKDTVSNMIEQINKFSVETVEEIDEDKIKNVNDLIDAFIDDAKDLGISIDCNTSSTYERFEEIQTKMSDIEKAININIENKMKIIDVHEKELINSIIHRNEVIKKALLEFDDVIHTTGKNEDYINLLSASILNIYQYNNGLFIDIPMIKEGGGIEMKAIRVASLNLLDLNNTNFSEEFVQTFDVQDNPQMNINDLKQKFENIAQENIKDVEEHIINKMRPTIEGAIENLKKQLSLN